MESIKRLQDSLNRKIEDEIRKRDDTIEELREKLRSTDKSDARSYEGNIDRYKRQIREKDKEIETLKAKSESYMRVLEETSERSITDAKKKTKREAISAEPITLRHSQALNFSLNKVSKSPSSAKVIKSAITSNEFMRHLDSTQIDEIVECMTEIKCDKDELIIREGEVGFKVYALEDGTVEVTKDKQVLSTLGSGKVFGELAILFNCTRAASVRALSKCRLWAIDRQSFQQIMMKTGLKRHAEHVDFLKTVPKLKELSEEALSEVADTLEEIHYEKGTYIIRQNNHGDTFFILSKGKVRVTENKEGSSGEVEKRTLHKGDYFGEKALEKAYVRTANVIVSDADGADCLCIDLETYEKLLRKVIVSSKDPKPAIKKTAPTPPPRPNEFASLFLSDLSILTTLGVGGFGRVELVDIKKSISKKTYALKLLKKNFIKQTRQIEHVKNEKNILMECSNDFIVKLHRTFKDRKYLYMLMDVCLGGELWTVLRDRQFFDDTAARFFTGCVIEAFDYLHERGIVYRDLKPENLLIEGLGSRKGYVKLVDFGFAKKVGHSKTWTFCGTPEYVAPEIILNKGHDVAADLWSLGILIYELLNGTPPFTNTDSMKTYNMILKGIDSVPFPKRISKNAIVIIKKFCRDVPTDRLGYGRTGYKDIQKQKWYSGFNWDGLKRGTLRPPIVPIVKDEKDTSRFDTYDSDSDEENTPEDLTGWDRDF